MNRPCFPFPPVYHFHPRNGWENFCLLLDGNYLSIKTSPTRCSLYLDQPVVYLLPSPDWITDIYIYTGIYISPTIYPIFLTIAQLYGHCLLRIEIFSKNIFIYYYIVICCVISWTNVGLDFYLYETFTKKELYIQTTSGLLRKCVDIFIYQLYLMNNKITM